MQGSRGALDLRRPGAVYLAVALTTLVLDQITKYLVRGALAPGESRALVAGVLDLTYVRNAGAAFGMLPGYRPMFMAVSFVVLVVVWGYWRRWHPTAWPVVLGLALVTSGALGNLIDRALIGRVTDFLALAFIDFPVFNVADSAIVVGVGLLVIWLLFGPQPEELQPESAQDAAADASEAER